MQNNMQNRIHRCAVIAAVALLAACSSTPPVEKQAAGAATDAIVIPGAETAGAPAAAAAAAMPDTAAAAAATSPAATPAAEGAALTGATTEAVKNRAGYRTRQRGGETVWCRKETTLGTNIKHELCYTEAQMAEIERKTDSMSEEMRKKMSTHICSPNCSN